MALNCTEHRVQRKLVPGYMLHLKSRLWRRPRRIAYTRDSKHRIISADMSKMWLHALVNQYMADAYRRTSAYVPIGKPVYVRTPKSLEEITPANVLLLFSLLRYSFEADLIKREELGRKNRWLAQLRSREIYLWIASKRLDNPRLSCIELLKYA